MAAMLQSQNRTNRIMALNSLDIAWWADKFNVYNPTTGHEHSGVKVIYDYPADASQNVCFSFVLEDVTYVIYNDEVQFGINIPEDAVLMYPWECYFRIVAEDGKEFFAYGELLMPATHRDFQDLFEDQGIY